MESGPDTGTVGAESYLKTRWAPAGEPESTAPRNPADLCENPGYVDPRTMAIDPLVVSTAAMGLLVVLTMVIVAWIAQRRVTPGRYSFS